MQNARMRRDKMLTSNVIRDIINALLEKEKQGQLSPSTLEILKVDLDCLRL